MGDQGDGDFSDADRKVRLQEKNRKAQQAFRSRQKSKIAELTEKCAQLEGLCSGQESKLHEVQHDNAVLQSALLTQSQQLDAQSAELAAICKKHNAHLWQPAASLQFDPSADISLKYPVTAEDGKAELLVVRGTDLLQGCGVDQLKRVWKDVWLPELTRLHTEYVSLQENVGDSDANASGAMASISTLLKQVAGIQQSIAEVTVKALRAQPVKARLAATDILFNCNVRLDHLDAMALADKVLVSMDMSPDEQEKSCERYDAYLCEMALLQVQRRNMLDQLHECYRCDKQAWFSKLESEQLQMKDTLAATAAVEALHLMLQKENELFCDLIACIVADVWQPVTCMKYVVLGAPGKLDILSLLSSIRQRVRQESAVSLTSAFIVKALSPQANGGPGNSPIRGQHGGPTASKSDGPIGQGKRLDFSIKRDSDAGPGSRNGGGGNQFGSAAAAVLGASLSGHSGGGFQGAQGSDRRGMDSGGGGLDGPSGTKRKLAMMEQLNGWDRSVKRDDGRGGYGGGGAGFGGDDVLNTLSDGYGGGGGGGASGVPNLPMAWRNLSLTHVSETGALKNRLSDFLMGDALGEMSGNGGGGAGGAIGRGLSITQLLQCDAYSDLLGKQNLGLSHGGQQRNNNNNRTLSSELLNGFAPSVQDLLRAQGARRGVGDSITQLLAAQDPRGMSGIQALLNHNNGLGLLPASVSGLNRDTLTCLSEHLDAQGYTGGSGSRGGNREASNSLRAGPMTSRKTPLQLHHDYTSFIGEDDLPRPKLT